MAQAAYLQVIRAAIDQGVSFDEVIGQRFPIGPGGVGHANRKTQQRIRQQIREFYEPRDYSDDDVIGRGLNESAQCG